MVLPLPVPVIGQFSPCDSFYARVFRLPFCQTALTVLLMASTAPVPDDHEWMVGVSDDVLTMTPAEAAGQQVRTHSATKTTTHPPLSDQPIPIKGVKIAKTINCRGLHESCSDHSDCCHRESDGGGAIGCGNSQSGKVCCTPGGGVCSVTDDCCQGKCQYSHAGHLLCYK